jgi:hypothetical protein
MMVDQRPEVSRLPAQSKAVPECLHRRRRLRSKRGNKLGRHAAQSIEAEAQGVEYGDSNAPCSRRYKLRCKNGSPGEIRSRA